MRHKILFLEQAKEDVHQARLYYNDILPNLGTRFRSDLRGVIHSIAESHPVMVSAFKTLE